MDWRWDKMLQWWNWKWKRHMNFFQPILWFLLTCMGEGKGNPLQCSCLENPRGGEPGGLPSMGSHRVGHDWSNLAAAAAEVLSHVQLFVTPWAIAHQAPLSMEFSRQEYCSGLPCLPPGNLPNPGIKPMSPVLQAVSLLSEPLEKLNMNYGVQLSAFKAFCAYLYLIMQWWNYPVCW